MTKHLFILVAVLSLQGSVRAQDDDPRPSAFREKGDYYPLGGLAAWGDVDFLPDKKTPVIVLKTVAKGGPADLAGLKEGDVIVSVDGKKFTKKGPEAVDELEAAIEDAEAVKGKTPQKGGTLKLELQGKTKPEPKLVTVEYFGPHSKTCPEKCEKCAAVLTRALDYLKKTQRGDGGFRVGSGGQNGDVVVSSLALLAWRGDKNQRYSAEIKKAAKGIAARAGKEEEMGKQKPGEPNWNQTNWPLAFAVMALSEITAKDSSNEWKPQIAEFTKKIGENQEATGGWAHGPGGPNALGYVELEVMSNLCLGAFGMAREAGIEPPASPLFKGVEYVKACTSGGGVAYSTRPGQAGFGDPGRTAGAYWAFRQLRRKEKVVGEMEKFYDRGMKDLPNGHASPVMHIWAGSLAAAAMGNGASKRFWTLYRPFIMAARAEGGAFDARPNDETRQLKSNGDRSVGYVYMTAAYAIVMQAGQDRFTLLDRFR